MFMQQSLLIIHTELTCRVCTNLFKYLPTQLKILYLGCGSGGDTLYFKNRGYQVDVIDDSAELVVKVRELTGVKVNQLSFSASQIRP